METPMTKKRPFFFDPEPGVIDRPGVTEGSSTFFNALKDAGIVQDASEDPTQITIEGSMKEKESQIVHIEFGTCKDDYSLHITPIHDKRNLDTKYKVELAIVEAIKLIVPTLPPSFHVDVYKPRDDWQMKVISIVIRKAARAWNFEKLEFERTVIPAIVTAVEKVIMS
jgi:hypothetical protein